MTEFGLVNVRIEPWVNTNGFERGWTSDKFYMTVTAPERFPIPGTPTGWTPGTNGLVSGDVVLMTATTAEELPAYTGKLKGKWVMLGAVPDVPAYWDPQAKRFTADQLAAMELNPPAPPIEFGMTPPGGGRAAGPAPQPAGGGRGGALLHRGPRRVPAGRRRSGHADDNAPRPRALPHRRQPDG